MADRNEAIELARKAIAEYESGKPVGLAVIATLDSNTAWSFTGYDPMAAHHLTARFEHWQLARLVKADLLNEARVNNELAGNVTVENARLEIVK